MALLTLTLDLLRAIGGVPQAARFLTHLLRAALHVVGASRHISPRADHRTGSLTLGGGGASAGFTRIGLGPDGQSPRVSDRLGLRPGLRPRFGAGLGRFSASLRGFDTGLFGLSAALASFGPSASGGAAVRG